MGFRGVLFDWRRTLESDPAWNTFADDAAPTLHALHDVGLHIAVVSDIHVDIRPSFAAAGLERLVDGAAVELGW